MIVPADTGLMPATQDPSCLPTPFFRQVADALNDANDSFAEGQSLEIARRQGYRAPPAATSTGARP